MSAAPPTQRLPWPTDAVMIIAAKAGEEQRDRMHVPVDAICRHCGAHLVADLFTIAAAAALPSRLDRPLKFFCFPCHELHRLEMCDQIIDHRHRGKNSA